MCEELISASQEPDFYSFCQKIYLGTAVQGFWLYESSLLKDVRDLYVNVTFSSGISKWNSNTQKMLVDMVYSNNFITQRAIRYIWDTLVSDSATFKTDV
jgi:hypothetical protein